MKTRTVFLLVASLLSGVSLSGCAEGQSQLKNNPLPSVSSISPSAVMSGSPAFSLIVNGSNFLSTSVVRWNGADQATTFVSSSQLTAAILASDIAGSGTVIVTVFSPAPGGGTSSGAIFTIKNPVPIVSALGPSSTIAGTGAFTLVVDGSNFVSSSVVQWNGTNRTTTFINSTRLAADISAGDVATATTANVTVANPAPGGGNSNAMNFKVMLGPPPALPVISFVSPASIMAGRPTFTLTVNGSGFTQTSVVRWNGSDRSTTCVSSTQLSAAILATDIANTGAATVTVFNPPPGGGISDASTYYVSPEGVGVVERVSVNNNSSQLEDAGSYVWFPGISGDGRFVAFYSVAHSNDPTKGASQVLVRDTCRGAPVGCTPSTVLASVTNDGSSGNGANLNAAVSADGRFAAFSSGSSNLVLDDTNGLDDVMLRDTCAGAPVGCTPSTSRVSVASDGTQGNGESRFPTISANGRYVAFYSEASNLVPDDTNGTGDGFVRDTCFGAPAGCVPSTIRVSVANDGSQGNYGGGIPSISANGRFVAFDSGSTNLITGYTGAWDGGADVFIRDTCRGTPTGCTPSTTLVSVASGSEGNQGAGGVDPVISANGRFVSFASYASNLVAGDTNDNGDIFVRDTCLGAETGCTPSTTRVSVGIDGSQGNNDSWISWGAPISGNGRFVAFSTWATNFVPGGNAQLDVFVRDTCAGAPADCIPSTVRVNVGSDGSPGSNVYDEYVNVAISADGRFVAFYSSAGLVSGDTNGYSDVFLARTGAADAPVVTSTAPAYPSATNAYLLTPKADAGAAPSYWSFAERTRPTDLSFISPRRRSRDTARAPVATHR